MDRSADSHPQSTLELVRKAQANDRAAFDLLVERHRYRLHSLITFRLGPSLRQRVEVEDVLQETYMKAFESIQGFAWRNEGSFFRWLTSIAQHVLQDFARRYLHTRRKKRPLEMSLSQDSPRGEDDPQGVTSLLQARSTSPSKAMQRNERFERLERALNTLSDDHREVILLARVHGLPIEEIAQQMDRSPDAVSMLLLRALRQLKKIFGDTDSLKLPPRSLGAPLEINPPGLPCPPQVVEQDRKLRAQWNEVRAKNGKVLSGLRIVARKWYGSGRDSDVAPPQ